MPLAVTGTVERLPFPVVARGKGRAWLPHPGRWGTGWGAFSPWGLGSTAPWSQRGLWSHSQILAFPLPAV